MRPRTLRGQSWSGDVQGRIRKIGPNECLWLAASTRLRFTTIAARHGSTNRDHAGRSSSDGMGMDRGAFCDGLEHLRFKPKANRRDYSDDGGELRAVAIVR